MTDPFNLCHRTRYKDVGSFNKHLKDQKKRKAAEEAETLAALAEFEQWCDGDKKETSFVRGETINPDAKPGSSTKNEPAKKPMYLSSKGLVTSKLKASLKDFGSDSSADKRRSTGFSDAGVAPVSSVKKTSSSKKSNLEAMMEEIKKESEDRGSRGGSRDYRGGRDSREPRTDSRDRDRDRRPGDETGLSTNLYIEVSRNVDEDYLMKMFGHFGPIANVKIMWPRGDDPQRDRHRGFVAYMTRVDAEAAIEAMTSPAFFNENIRVLDFGKPVVLPDRPIYPLPGPQPSPESSAPPAQFGRVAPPMSDSGRDDPSRAPGISPVQEPPSLLSAVTTTVRVHIPVDPRVKKTIDTLASYVMKDGLEFEQNVLEEQRSNPEFRFLLDTSVPEHWYYRWRIYSLCQGDSFTYWRKDPFVMVSGGSEWIPPPLPTAQPRESEDQRSGAAQAGSGELLTDDQLDEFEQMLRTLTVARSQIAAAMAFALDHAHAASEFVQILTEALTLTETPLPTKVARLFLVSDILYNSAKSGKKAQGFRTGFEASLPAIFESLQEAYAMNGRISQQEVKTRVLAVLHAWRDWGFFPTALLNRLEATFTAKNSSKQEEADEAPHTVADSSKANVALLPVGLYDSDDDGDDG